MANPGLPREWNGVPTEYTFFDGFMRSGLGMKALYILGLPWASALIEAYHYNESKKAAQGAEDAARISQSSAQSTVNDRKAESIQNMPDINPGAPENGKFQESVAAANQSQGMQK